jgi:DHA1 family bicyclomycin/chloramphenicol resistance-like MFS transporter
MLVLARILQAVGGASGHVTATSIIRDLYTGRKQERILSVQQSMVMICPVIAPLIGAVIMQVLSWPGIFYAQGLMGIIVLIGALIMHETIKEKNDVGVLHTIVRLWVVLKNGRFAYLLVISSVPQLPLMAYIVASPYIFQNFFDLSSVTYSLYFGAAALGTIVGPLLYMFSRRIISKETFLTICFSGMVFGGVLTCFVGTASPLTYSAIMFFMAMFTTTSKVPSGYYLLNYQRNDIGSASALISSGTFLIGSIGMAIAGIPLNSVVVTGSTYGLSGLLLLIMILFLIIRHREELPR